LIGGRPIEARVDAGAKGGSGMAGSVLDPNVSITDMTKSREMLDEAAKVVPGGVHSGRRKLEPPMCVKRAHGAYVEDVDGNRFIDYHAAWGVILLGHSYPYVVDRVSEAIRERVMFSVGTTESELALSQKIVEHVPSVEQVLFCGSGSESTFYAIRVARGFTNREKVLKFQGCYNGFHDFVLRGNLPTAPDAVESTGEGNASLSRYNTAGIFHPALESTIVCTYNDLDDVEAAVAANPEQIAAMIVEPILHNAATIHPKPGFLEGLREICSREGIVLIFDEVITGFRHSLGGYQQLAGVTPDLTCMGKALGTGFQIAALGGRADIMERFTTTADGDVWFGGSYNGNEVGVAAALANIHVLETENVYEHTFRLGERMRNGLDEIVSEAGIPHVVAGFGGLYVLMFLEPPLEMYDDYLRNDVNLFLRYRRQLIKRGVFEMPENVGRNHISFSHTDDDIDRTLDASRDALRAALDEPAGRP
jgi:glutamate-1-semialdehyde 2,1-aminomutase